MLFFGPCTIKHGGVDLGKTAGGISINLISHQRMPIGSYNPETLVVGGNAVASFYEWPNAIGISDSTSLLGFDEVILNGSPRYTITLYNCKILFDVSGISIGKNSYEPVKIKLVFKPDNSGNIINIA